MKKLMIMALMAGAATTAFAQEDLVKQAKKQFSAGDFDQAAATLAPALTSDATTDKAAAWNLQTDIMAGKFSAIQSSMLENQVAGKNVPFDTLGMNIAAYEALKAAIECDKYDIQPNEKGKVKIRFRQANQQRMQIFKTTELLHIDDVGTEPASVKVWGNEVSPLVEILYSRYDKLLYTVITSNLSDEDILPRYGVRIADRFREMFDFLSFDNKSYR